MAKSDWLDKTDDDPGADQPASEPFAPPPQAPTAPKAPKWPWVMAAACVVLLGVIIGATVIELPYYTLNPGSVRDTGAVIQVDGVPTYDASGTINYTTVQISPATALDLFWAWVDDDIDVEDEETILGDRNPEENRRLNLALMDFSQQDATVAALEALGYDVQVTSGMYVEEVLPEQPADGKLDPDDVIVEADGVALEDGAALERVMSEKRPGDQLELVVRHVSGPDQEGALSLGEPRTETLTLAENPEQEGRAFMGISITQFDLVEDYPVDVGFDIRDVGGPSAGLAFALTIIDEMTEGELTGGLDVAVTGAIDKDGNVLSVGGTGQKAAAARSADMDLMLVPSAGQDYDNAVPHAGDVDVVRVATVDQALEALAEYGGNGLELPDLGDGDAGGVGGDAGEDGGDVGEGGDAGRD